jgi:hypothetical protein
LYLHDANLNQELAPHYGSTSAQIANDLAWLPLVAVAYLSVRRLNSPDWMRWAYWAAIAVELAYAAGSGARANVLSVAFVVLATVFYAQRRFPVRAVVVITAVTIFVVFPALYLYRGTYNSPQSSSTQTGVASYEHSGIKTAALYGLGTTLGRFNDIIVPALLVERGRRVYRVTPGSTLLWVFADAVPHALWLGKPSVSTFAGNFGQAVGLQTTNSSAIAVTEVGELYLNFGVLGMSVMLLIGGVYRELGEWLRERWRSPLVLALYASMMFLILESSEGILAAELGGTVQTTLVLAFLLWLALRLCGKVQRAA